MSTVQKKQALCGERYLRKHKELHHHQTIMWAHNYIVAQK